MGGQDATLDACGTFVGLSTARLLCHHEGRVPVASGGSAFFIYRPSLFAELRDKWPERPPSDENLRSYLIRRGFTQTAMEQVIQFYRETLDMVGKGGSPQNPAPPQRSGEESMTVQVAPTPVAVPPVAGPGSKPFAISFDGSMLTGTLALRTVRDIERLMKVLQAQKAAFEAMSDDEAGEEEAEEAHSV